MKPVHGSSPLGRRAQMGLSLIESMVAMLVMALGMLGLAGVQSRLLVETRTANARAIAVSLMDDLKNRMMLNPRAVFLPALPANPNSPSSAYLVNFDDAIPTAPTDCAAANCSPANLASYDLNQWLSAVKATLPAGQASVFFSTTDPRQFGIAIAWAENEGAPAQAGAASAAQYRRPFQVTVANSGIDCPAQKVCHVAYVQP